MMEFHFLYYINLHLQKKNFFLDLKLYFGNKIQYPYNLITNRIINIYEKKQSNKKIYESLKEISYNIIKFNLDIPTFYKVFLSEILKDQKIRDKQKYELIKLFADSEYNYNKSYRSIIILESLLFHVYKYYLL